ncbi:MAG: radical SAM protein [Lachnospiraceae bacterium]|nr:radical SAM protein [Lachnospiraceae bacterium]
MKPLICPIKTPLGYYFYETQRNEIITVNEEIYERITNWDSVEKMKYSERNEKTEYAINELKELGYLNEPYIEKLEHPATRYLDIMLERKVSKILLQLTQKCNLRCHYCVYSEEKNLGTRSHSNKNMSYETAKKAIDFYMNHSVDCEEKVIGFYGGEPLLQFDLIKRIIDYCNKTFRGHRILYTITTNGTLLTDEIIDFLVKNRVSITVSLDGPKEIHDKNRKYINNEGSYDTVMKNLKKLKTKCDNEKQCSVNMVIDTDNEYKKISDFFNEPIIKNIRVRWNIVEEDNNVKAVNEQFISNFEYQTFLGYVRYLRENNFVAPDGLVQGEFENRAIVDSHFNSYFLPNITAPGGPCIPGKLRLMVDCDGKFFPCERISETSICTNIGSLDDGFDNEKINSLLNIAQLTEECKNCWAFSLCSVCAKQAVNKDKLCVESKRKQCTVSRRSAWNQLMDRILLYENRIHEKKMNTIKEGVF